MTSDVSSSPLIRTPDQRLRVFVSSTLQELLPERQAAQSAIRRLHLSPVMFELGARPHPPRELYRAYLDQSHIFVGIYWERYGWVAPDEEVSGLEDEYRLCGDKPKLIYVKASAQREDRLKDLLKRVQADDTASYKPFRSAAELQRLLVDDLALLLTERFEAGLSPAAVVVPAPTVPDAPSPVASRPAWPRPATPLVGRGREQAALSALLSRPDVHLVSLLGAGGIGKTRLALAAGEPAAEQGTAIFVSLAGISEPALVVPAIADAVEVPDDTDSRVVALHRALGQRTALLLLDNFEQVTDAAPDVASLLAACPELTVLVTSRAPLRLAAEHEFQVPPLAAPPAGASLDILGAADAVALFVSRAQAVRPSFALTTDNGAAVAELTRRLDGLPLAIELAAARTKLLTPEQLLTRIDQRFELLGGGARDLPSRQQTLRGAIDWSFDLLEPADQRILIELGVFAGGWSLVAGEQVCDPDGTAGFLERLATLVDSNLVYSRDVGDGIRFELLESIRAYALEKLVRNGAAQVVQERHAAYFLGWAEEARAHITGSQQALWLARLDTDHDNLRAALAHYAESSDGQLLARLATSLTYFWWIRGHYNEGRRWLTTALDRTHEDHSLRSRTLKDLGTLAWVQGDYAAAKSRYQAALALVRESGDEAELASALGNLGIVSMEQDDLGAAEPLLQEALQINRRLDEPATIAPSLINLSLLMMRRGELGVARQHLQEAVELSRRLGDTWRLTTALINLGEVLVGQGETRLARDSYEESVQLAFGLQDMESIAYALEGSAGIAAAEADAARAAQLWGAAEALRESSGNPRPPTTGTTGYAADVARIHDELGPEAFERQWRQGRSAPLEHSVGLATQR